MAPNVVLWSACGESQTAADASIAAVFTGAFTFNLCKHLREGGNALPRADLLRRVQASLAQAGFTQIPELSASDALLATPAFCA
jgi:hypothetical protein